MAKKKVEKLTVEKGYAHCLDAANKSSEITRQLALAGIALVWIFKIDIDGKQVLPPQLFYPALLFVTGIALDLLHYAIKGEVWLRITRFNEDRGITEFEVTKWVGRVLDTFYWLKIAVVLAGYVLLVDYILENVFP